MEVQDGREVWVESMQSEPGGRHGWLVGGLPLSLTELGTESGGHLGAESRTKASDWPANGMRSGEATQEDGTESGSAETGLDAVGAAGLAHDARNLLTALHLYSDLLEEPGVLPEQYRHYADDLRKVATASGGLLDKLIRSRAPQQHRAVGASSLGMQHCFVAGNWQPVEDLAAEVMACSDLLAALAGPQIKVEVECQPCAAELWLSMEDLMRVLVNLVRNAAEAMGDSGTLQIAVRPGASRRLQTDDAKPDSAPDSVVLTVTDDGPGILRKNLDHIFDPGFTTQREPAQENGAEGPDKRRGMGLSIVRSLVEAAGGRVRAESFPGRGTRFELELPVAGKLQNAVPLVTDSRKGSRIEC